MTKHLINQIISLLNQSDDQLTVLEQIIAHWSKNKPENLHLLIQCLNKQNKEVLFKERLLNLKTNSTKPSSPITEYERKCFELFHTNIDKKELALFKQWANEIDLLDYYNSLIN